LGRAQWRFTVFAQDEGGEGLVGYSDVQVNLKDINDCSPVFPLGIYYGNVTENGTSGKTCSFLFIPHNVTLGNYKGENCQKILQREMKSFAKNIEIFTNLKG